jgi:hypothetical protein
MLEIIIEGSIYKSKLGSVDAVISQLLLFGLAMKQACQHGDSTPQGCPSNPAGYSWV